jgi:FimV-like protein
MTLFFVLLLASLLVSAVVMDGQYAASRGWAPLWKSGAHDNAKTENSSEASEHSESESDFDFDATVAEGRSVMGRTKTTVGPTVEADYLKGERAVPIGSLTNIATGESIELFPLVDEGEDGADTLPSRVITDEFKGEHSGLMATAVGLRLDLARAYLDEGNAAGARDILEEVLDAGDEEQRRKAQNLLDEIAS